MHRATKVLLCVCAFYFCFWPQLGNGALKKLKPNSIVDIVAPSQKARPGELQRAEEYVRSLGLIPRVSGTVYGSDILYANANFKRAQNFKDALLSDSDAIWAIRGGCGAAEILPYLEGEIDGFDGLPRVMPKEKLLIGFCDFTAIHLYMAKFYNWQTLHAPMLMHLSKRAEGESKITLKANEESEKALKKVIFDNAATSVKYKINLIQNTKSNTAVPDIIEGEVIGGNLTLVVQSIGTSWEIDTKNKILFLEDINDPSYKLERSLTHLIQAGKFDNVKAVLLGDFSEVIDKKNIPIIEKRFVDKFAILNRLNANTPVFKLSGVGHETTNMPLPLNAKATIKHAQDGHYITITYA